MLANLSGGNFGCLAQYPVEPSVSLKFSLRYLLSTVPPRPGKQFRGLFCLSDDFVEPRYTDYSKLPTSKVQTAPNNEVGAANVEGGYFQVELSCCPFVNGSCNFAKIDETGTKGLPCADVNPV